MPDNNRAKIDHYRTYMRMYGEMLQDLSHSRNYIIHLIDNKGLSEFEAGLRTLIEKALK